MRGPTPTAPRRRRLRTIQWVCASLVRCRGLTKTAQAMRVVASVSKLDIKVSEVVGRSRSPSASRHARFKPATPA